MSRFKDINKALRNYDECLYIQESHAGRYDLYRKSKFGCNPPNFIFSITDDWTVSGRPVEWGIDNILNRLKAHDLWRDDKFVENYIKEHEKDEESKARDRRNSIEAFMYDFRRQFARATDSVNTSTLPKLHRKEDGHGYLQS